MKPPLFYPKIISALQGYRPKHLLQDSLAGLIVGIVALPLCIAFGIASGVTPEQGLITGVIGGFLISALGGSRVQIGGPTGAFIVIIYSIVHQHGINGLWIATMIAGVLLIAMGCFRLGDWIKFIPTPVVIGFTSGIAAVIFISQIKDVFGLEIQQVPATFLEKWPVFWDAAHTVNLWAVLISAVTIGVIAICTHQKTKIPGPFLALVCGTALVQGLGLPVETIGSRFGEVQGQFPPLSFPQVTWPLLKELFVPGVTIALLAAIESLLSAVVADGMIGGRHRSNTELIAQGVANLASPLFGGIAATGAIARTATNVRSGGRTPIAGMVHALVLLAILIFFGRWAALIPMAVLAGILVVVSYNMSEWREFRELLQAPRSEVGVLLVTFGLTVFLDLVIAIQVGIMLSAFLFMNRMAEVSNIKRLQEDVINETDADTYYSRPDSLSHQIIPPHVEVFEVNGAFFFGAALKFEETLRDLGGTMTHLILRMNNVYVLDATGLHVLTRLAQQAQTQKVHLMLAEVHDSVLPVLKRSKVYATLGPENFLPSLSEALKVASARRAFAEGSPPGSSF